MLMDTLCFGFVFVKKLIETIFSEMTKLITEGQ